MKGGGVSRGSRVPHTYFEKWFFLKKTFRIIPWLWKRVLHLVWALLAQGYPLHHPVNILHIAVLPPALMVFLLRPGFYITNGLHINIFSISQSRPRLVLHNDEEFGLTLDFTMSLPWRQKVFLPLPYNQFTTQNHSVMLDSCCKSMIEYNDISQ